MFIQVNTLGAFNWHFSNILWFPLSSPQIPHSAHLGLMRKWAYYHHIIPLCISALVSCFNRNDSRENEVTKMPYGLNIKSVFLIKLKGTKEKAQVKKALILQSVDFLAKFYNMQSAVWVRLQSPFLLPQSSGWMGKMFLLFQPWQFGVGTSLGLSRFSVW